MSELVDVYNDKKEKTGKIVERKRGASLEKGEYIISVTCWIINSNGEILLTRRKLDKHNGGLWEPTTGQDAVLSIHHCYMHTFANSLAVKIIENHKGIATVAIAQNIQKN